MLFSRIKNKTADWVNLRNLWILRDCVRENYNHGIGVDDIIFGEDFDGENLDTLTPLTKKRFDYLCMTDYVSVTIDNTDGFDFDFGQNNFVLRRTVNIARR